MVRGWDGEYEKDCQNVRRDLVNNVICMLLD